MRKAAEAKAWSSLATVAILTLGASHANSAPRWVLIYQRQIGNHVNNSAQTMETHVFNENGTKFSGVGVTNQSNPGTPIFGYTDGDGWNRVTFDENNCAYDVTIYSPSVVKDYSPTFYWQNPLSAPNHYSFVTHWLYVSDDVAVEAFPANPVYHYDLMSGLNHANGFNPGCQPYGWQEAPGANSDAVEYASGGWSTYQAQTFVVPAGVNRIISVQSWLTRSWQDPDFYYWASIHQGGPTGPQIGPRLTSPLHHSVNFKEEAVCWGIADVPVVPGQTYALKLEPTDGAGSNVWRTTANNYAGGCLYNGSTQVSGHDMVAVVVGVGYDDEPPTIQVIPTSFEPTVIEGHNVADDHNFTVANTGGGTMTYSITDNASWLSVDPSGGSSSGEADSIHINYDTSGLNDGEYTATITVQATGATNTPQYVTVNLTVYPPLYAPCDFNQDDDVDQEDFGRFQACYTGQGYPQNEPACAGARLDTDEDVDLDDFAKFMQCISGPGVQADPDCTD